MGLLPEVHFQQLYAEPSVITIFRSFRSSLVHPAASVYTERVEDPTL